MTKIDAVMHVQVELNRCKVQLVKWLDYRADGIGDIFWHMIVNGTVKQSEECNIVCVDMHTSMSIMSIDIDNHIDIDIDIACVCRACQRQCERCVTSSRSSVHFLLYACRVLLRMASATS